MPKHIIFTNYYSQEREDSAREFLFETSEEYETIDDIPDFEVWDEMAFEEETWFDDVMSELKHFFEDKTLVVKGSLGLWDGRRNVGAVVPVEKLNICWEGCDYMEIYDENGHLYISSSHHDGTNTFEVKVLTEKGEQFFERNGQKFNSLFKSTYSHIPHFAREVYGCKTR